MQYYSCGELYADTVQKDCRSFNTLTDRTRINLFAFLKSFLLRISIYRKNAIVIPEQLICVIVKE